MTPESKVKAAVKKILAAYGAWFCMPVGGMFGRSGVPDFLVCHNGYFIAIETKAGKGKATALQNLEMEKIRASGGATYVINEQNLAELENILNAFCGESGGVPGKGRDSGASDNASAKGGIGATSVE